MKSKLLLGGLIVITAMICSLSVAAQPAGQQPRPNGNGTGRSSGNSNGSGGNSTVASAPGPSVIMSADEDYKVAPSDVIEVIVDDAPELSVKYRINSSGNIPLRYLGATPVAGMNCDEIAKYIADGLRGRYLKDPKVFVSVFQYNSRSFFIQGAVRAPGVYVIEGKPSLFKLITIAGGLQENHGANAYIFRETKAKPEKLETGEKGKLTGENQTDDKLGKIVDNAKGTDGDVQIEGDNDYELITANIGGILRGRLSNNTYIQPSDVVYVPPADVFYVAGEVRSPGQFPLKLGVTLRQALSLAQGSPFKASLNKGIIFREDPTTGKFTEIAVDMDAVVSGKKEDMQILPNDIVYVPTSTVKSVSGVLLNALATAAIFRLPIGGR
jgi:polysaccharide biosynthesis/export protein